MTHGEPVTGAGTRPDPGDVESRARDNRVEHRATSFDLYSISDIDDERLWI